MELHDTVGVGVAQIPRRSDASAAQFFERQRVDLGVLVAAIKLQWSATTQDCELGLTDFRIADWLIPWVLA